MVRDAPHHTAEASHDWDASLQSKLIPSAASQSRKCVQRWPNGTVHGLPAL